MIIHVVSPGESVYSIAQSYNVSPLKIIRDNDLTDPDNLVVGQTIVIREPDVVYQVQPFDTLQQIANMYNTTTTDLLQKNPFISFTAMIDRQSWIQINAETVFAEDMATKEMIISNNQVLKKRFQTADNRILKIFKLSGGTAKFYDRSGNAPRIVNF